MNEEKPPEKIWGYERNGVSFITPSVNLAFDRGLGAPTLVYIKSQYSR